MTIGLGCLNLEKNLQICRMGNHFRYFTVRRTKQANTNEENRLLHAETVKEDDRPVFDPKPITTYMRYDQMLVFSCSKR